VEEGNEVTVLATDFKYAHGKETVDKQPENVNGVRVYRVSAFRFGRDPFTYGSELKKFLLANQNDFDVLHTFTYGYHTSVIPARMKKQGKLAVPIVFSPHYAPAETVPGFMVKLFDSTLGKMTVQQADRVVLLTENYMDFFMEQGAARDIVSIIPPIVPATPEVTDEQKSAFLAKYVIPDGCKYVVSIGRILKYKGIQHVIEGMRVLKDRGELEKEDVHLIVGGDGEFLPNLKEMVKDYDLVDRVSFTGMLSEDEKNVLYRLSDVFAFLSYSGESFGIVLVEAMSCGIPVLASDRGAVPVVVNDGRNGLVVDPFDHEVVADSLVRLLGSDVTRKMQENNIEDAAMYSKDEIVRKYVDLYSSVL